MKKQISYKIVSLVFSILVLCFAIAFYAVGWDEPGTPPPGGNVPAPLNTGDTSQYKLGALGIGGVFRAYSNAIIDGNVGIGTTSPSQKLEVNGNLKLSTANPYIYSGGSYIVIPNGLYVSGGTGYFQNTLMARNGIQNDGAVDSGYVRIKDSLLVDSWLRTSGATGWYSQSYGGGWYMVDATWIRSYGSKSIYHNTGILRTDGTFQVGPSGNRFIVNTTGNVGIGTTSPSQKLDVAGYVKGQTGLCIGNDCRTTWPAGGVDTRCDTSGTCGQVCIGASCRATWPTGGTGDITGVTAGTGLTGGGTSGSVTLNADTGYVQRRVTGTCGSNKAIRVINSNGTVSCVTIPSAAICSWNDKTYSTGAKCNPTSSCCCRSGSCPSNREATCRSDGSWSIVGTGSNCDCPRTCGM